jgi:hypothetical protein
MAKANRRKITVPTAKRLSRKSLRGAKKSSLALRSSVALARATALFADLHERVQKFVIDDLSAFTNDLRLDSPLPAPVNKVPEMVVVVSDLEKAFTSDASWGVDPAKFNLTGQQLWSATQGKNLSYLVQFVYQRAHDALRT